MGINNYLVKRLCCALFAGIQSCRTVRWSFDTWTTVMSAFTIVSALDESDRSRLSLFNFCSRVSQHWLIHWCMCDSESTE